jgi:hypothetical protein
MAGGKGIPDSGIPGFKWDGETVRTKLVQTMLNQLDIVGEKFEEFLVEKLSVLNPGKKGGKADVIIVTTKLTHARRVKAGKAAWARRKMVAKMKAMDNG